MNVFVGLMARGGGERRRSYLSADSDEALCKLFAPKSSGCKVHVSSFGKCVDSVPPTIDDLEAAAAEAGLTIDVPDVFAAFHSAATPTEAVRAAADATGVDMEALMSLCECSEITQSETIMKLSPSRSAYPIYAQVLQMGELQLTDQLRSDIETNLRGFVLEFSTDSLLYLAVENSGHVLTRPGIVPVGASIDGYRYWDDARCVPLLKWEPVRKLRMTHRPITAVPEKFALPGLEWTHVIEDGPEVALRGDWSIVAKEILQLRGANIDGPPHGPPGTGKSSLVRCMMRVANADMGGCIALAPTNKAARNLGDSGHTVAWLERQWRQAQTGGKNHAIMDILARTSCIFVDEISMLPSTTYALLQEVRHMCAHLRMYMIGDFRQLGPIDDPWKGSDYKGSSALHYLCNGNRVQLSHCRRSDSDLFRAYMNADDVNPRLRPSP